MAWIRDSAAGGDRQCLILATRQRWKQEDSSDIKKVCLTVVKDLLFVSCAFLNLQVQMFSWSASYEMPLP